MENPVNRLSSSSLTQVGSMEYASPEEEAKAFYARENLQPPCIPEALKNQLTSIAAGEIWGTDFTKTLGDPIAWATEALQSKDIPDNLTFGYKNGSIHYYLKLGPLVLAMERRWSGFSPNKASAVNWLTAAPKLSLLKLKSAAPDALNPNKRIILVDSDTHPHETGYRIVDIRQLDPKDTWESSALDANDTVSIGSLPLNILDLLK